MSMLELDDIQSGVLRPRPAPYAATYILLRIDDRDAGRELMGRLAQRRGLGRPPDEPGGRHLGQRRRSPTQGLEALGVPQDSLDSFAWEFRQGMAARAKALGDTGESSPEHWERPLGTSDVHVVLTALSPDQAAARSRARARPRGLRGPSGGRRRSGARTAMRCPPARSPSGSGTGSAIPPIEGSGIPGTNPHEQPFKAGEFVLGYPDETGGFPPMPRPEVLGRNGTYVVFRKLHQRVAAFRQYLKENASSPDDEELLAAKMMGRWRSGAPLALCPLHDDPELGADPQRNNDFVFADDATGYKTPPGSHIRRANPRDASVAGVVRLHRMIRRGTAYGPELPEGVLEDDGVDRGLMFAFVGAHLGRQFEFVQSEWINGGDFLGLGDVKDPIAGRHDGAGAYSIPRRPIPRRLRGLPRFVVTRGGEYCFMPGLRALRWLAELRDMTPRRRWTCS